MNNRQRGREAGRQGGREAGRQIGRRQGGREAGRQGGREAGRQGGRVAGRQGGREAGRQGGREAGRQGGRETGRQGGREAGRQGGREAGRQGGYQTGRLTSCNFDLLFDSDFQTGCIILFAVCPRTCPQGGVSVADCSQCLCAGDSVSGKVTDRQTSLALANVNIYTVGRQWSPSAVSGSDGRFTISGVCVDGLKLTQFHGAYLRRRSGR